MPSVNQLLLASAVLGMSASALPAKPHSHHSHNKTSTTTTTNSFKFEMVPKTRQTARSGPASYLKSLRKYGGHQDRIDSVSAVQAGNASASSVVATPADSDLEYTCPVTIGSQTFELDFDTGSSDLWILGSSLSSGGSSHTFYQPGSTASTITGSSWKISYGDGSSASGKVYSDTVTIGNTTVTGQAVESADIASSDFTAESSVEDGLVGLAFDDINTVSPTPAKTFFSNAVDQGLPQALFTALLKKGEPGAYTFGELDSTQYTGDITYTDVDSSQGFWTFSPSSYSVGSSAGSASASALTGIADTGTTLLLIDDTVVEDYYSQVSSAQLSNSAGGYVFDCSADLPDFTLTIENYQATVPGSYINYAANGDGTCYGGIQSSSGIGFSIYGDIFLKSQFVVFDRTQDTPRLGFAAQA